MEQKRLLTVENLGISFKSDSGWSQAIKDVSFTVDTGQVVGLVGESGSGKSVTTRALMRLLPNTARIEEGSKLELATSNPLVDLDQQGFVDVAKMSRSDKRLRHIRGGEIAMIFQEPMASFAPTYRIGDPIMEAAMLHRGINKEQAREVALDLIERVGITDPKRRIDQYPFEFSGGMRQRVMIAVALASRPNLLIADEPTTALDVTIQAQILDLLVDLRDEFNMAVIFITHDLAVMNNIADDVVVMYRGEVMESGPVKKVISTPSHDYTKRLLEAIPRMDTFLEQTEDHEAVERVSVNETDSKSLSLPEDVVLSVRDLEVHFPIREGFLNRRTGEVRAVDGVSFDVYRNETLGLVGESGSGKTTIGRAILRALDPTGGQVLFQRKGEVVDLAAMSRKGLRAERPHLQMIFQDPYSSLNPRMTVRDIIAEPLVAMKLASGSEVDDRVREIAKRCKIDLDHLKRYPHAFSGGQRQRIGIARALVSEPSFVVADESVSALDVSIQAEIMALMVELQEELGVSTLFISHDMAVVAHLSHRVAVLYQGQLVELAPAAELFRSPKEEYTQRLLEAVPTL